MTKRKAGGGKKLDGKRSGKRGRVGTSEWKKYKGRSSTKTSKGDNQKKSKTE